MFLNESGNDLKLVGNKRSLSLTKLLLLISFLCISVTSSGKTKVVYIQSPYTNTTYYKRLTIYSTSIQPKVGYEAIGQQVYLYRKALNFNLESIPLYATIDSCRIEYDSGETCGNNNGSLEFKSIPWDFPTRPVQTVFNLLQTSSTMATQSITSISNYRTSLQQLVSTIQGAIASSYKYIGIGVYNSNETSSFGTSFKNCVLRICYSIPSPPAPTNVAYNPTALSFALSWTAPSGEVLGYNIYKDNNLYTQTTSTNINISGLCPGSSTIMKIEPFNSYGNGESVTITCNTLSYSITSSTGSNPVCISSDATFTFQNRPSGVSITWTKSSNFQQISVNNTDNYVVRGSTSGDGWVTATLSSGCGAVTTKSIWVGTPVVSVSGPYEGCTNTQYTFQAHTQNPTYTDPFSYSWDIYPYDGNISTSNGGNYAAYAYITFYNEYSVSGYQVKARAQNSCGTGAYGQTNIWIQDCYYFMLSPNPATESVTIYRTKSNSTKEKATSISLEELSKVYTIKIVDFYGVLHYNTKKSGETFTIPINNLKDGSYLVQITEGKDVYSLQLLVKH